MVWQSASAVLLADVSSGGSQRVARRALPYSGTGAIARLGPSRARDLDRGMTDLFDDPIRFFSRLILQIPALLVAVTVHELAHALVADRLRGPTPRGPGRVNLTPRAAHAHA